MTATATRILFRDGRSSFCPTKRLRAEDWIDTSFSQSPRAVGRLRLPAVSNGNYETKHPILDENGVTVGFMVGGASSLGYTFTCVYAGDCFWVAHQGFGAVIRGIDMARVSLIDATGTFIFSRRGAKFRVVKSFRFGESWVDNIRAFKLLGDGSYLFYLAACGACLFDTRMREVVAKVDLTNLAYQWSGFTLSPKANVLAIGFSVRGDKDLLDGEYRYRNFVRLYDLETGVSVGEQTLPGDRETKWAVDFSEDGRQLGVASDLSTHVFELLASS